MLPANNAPNRFTLNHPGSKMAMEYIARQSVSIKALVQEKLLSVLSAIRRHIKNLKRWLSQKVVSSFAVNLVRRAGEMRNIFKKNILIGKGERPHIEASCLEVAS